MSAESSVESSTITSSLKLQHGLTTVVAANLNLTPDEKRLYGQLFRQADTGNAGVVTGEVAVKFFEKTGLDSRVLGEVGQCILPSFKANVANESRRSGRSRTRRTAGSSRPRASVSSYDSSAMLRLAANQHKMPPSSPARSLDSKAWALRGRSDLLHRRLRPFKPRVLAAPCEFLL